MGILLDILVSLGPVIIFVVAMAVVYFRGNKINKGLIINLEEKLNTAIDPYITQMKKVEIRPNEFEFRCSPKNKNLKILTIHLKLVNRSFIIQWIVNLFVKENERIFLGAKIAGSQGEEDPVYHFDVVPYHRKGFIKKRFDTFVEYDDIPTSDKKIDRRFMVKSESRSYVEHYVDNKEFMRLLFEVEPYLEHIGLQKSKEDTDPHIACTFEFKGLEENPIEVFIKLFFLVITQHFQNRESVKKLIAKGSRVKGQASRHGSAARGGASKRKTKKKKIK